MIEPPTSSMLSTAPSPEPRVMRSDTSFSLPEIAVALFGVFCILYLLFTHGVAFTCARIGGIEPSWFTQNTGQLTCGRSITGLKVSVGGTPYENTLCTHAPSIIEFRNPNDSVLTIKAGLPDYLLDRGGSVEFFVDINGAGVWRSGITRPGMLMSSFVDLAAGDIVQLRVSDAGDNQNWDHACWLELKRQPREAR